MVETVNYQCPACGGPLHFSGETGGLVCDYCDSTFTVKQVEDLYAAKQEKAEGKAEKEKRRAQKAEGGGANGAGDATAEAAAAGAAGAAGVAAGAASVSDNVVAAGAAQAAKAAEEGLDPIQAYLKRSNWNDAESETLATSVCSSCGAELIHDQTTAVAQCPYCGNNTVIPGTMAGTLKPDYVIPFKMSKTQAVDALKHYYKGKKFLPNAFAETNHVEEIQGVYVPFWLYSARADAQATFAAENIRTWREDDYQITETDHYAVERAGYMDFTRVPVDGSQKMPDAHMDSIEPYDYSEITPFSVAYLPGYLTDRFDMDVAACQPRATERMKSTAQSELRNTVVEYDSVSSGVCTVDEDLKEVSYALLPVWMLHTKWNDQDFLFAMNGQTGKLIGDLPIDNGKVASWFLRIFIPLVAVAGAVSFLML